MARVRYKEVGKNVLAAIIGGTGAGAIHIMILDPQFPGQIYGIYTAAIVDWIIAFVTGVATQLYAKTFTMKLLGFSFAGMLGALGVLQQLGIFGPAIPVVRTVRVTTPVRTNLNRTPTAVAVGTYRVTA